MIDRFQRYRARELVLGALQLVEAHPLPHIMCPRYRLDDCAPALGSDVLCPSIHPFNWPHSDFSPGCDVPPSFQWATLFACTTCVHVTGWDVLYPPILSTGPYSVWEMQSGLS